MGMGSGLGALPLLLCAQERRARGRLQHSGRAVRVEELLQGEHPPRQSLGA